MRKSLGGKPKGAMKVKVILRWLRWDPGLRDPGAPPSHRIGSSERWRKSAHVGTRKMVNYA